ncbi:MAG: hypothetical protein CSYNP_02242 [Syntrophus sp. SKADARSKE-3]|nr:hypothetical protein [Syntrophus sp. SKADARSKE-3]
MLALSLLVVDQAVDDEDNPLVDDSHDVRLTMLGKEINVFMKRIGICLVLLMIAVVIEAAPLVNIPVKIKQPGGQEIVCLASGDEFYSWLHDQDGYTIIQDSTTGYYTYAVRGENGALISSKYIVGIDDPQKEGLERQLKLSPDKIREKTIKQRDLMFPQVQQRRSSRASISGPLNAPQKGVINNLVVFIRFSDEEEFTENITTYESLFNAASAGANSMRNYFAEVSYNKLTISSTFYPTPGTTILSYKDTQPRSYYRPYNAATNPNGYAGDDNRTVREHTLLKRAVDAISSLVPSSLVIDGDNDGYVDNICFIIKGGVDGWSNLLWPHYWQLNSQTAIINGKKVSNYNFQLQDYLASRGVGVLCHEMFHTIGAPDLYHYSLDAMDPVGKWDLMDVNSNPPRHMGAYMKMRYGGWISSIPRITTTGTYSLTPLQTSASAYIIPSLCSSSEYFVVEYRKKTGTFEASLPGEGLLVYRINSMVDDKSGNINGPPDEVYLYRPGGTAQVKGEPDNAAYSSTAGRTQINDSTSPSSFLANGGVGCLNLSNVGALGNTLSFDVTVGAEKTVSNSIGARNLVKITDRSGTLSASGAAVTVKAWDANGNEISASGDVSPLTVSNFATLSVSGQALASRFPTGTPVVYEFTVASPKYIITNVKSSSDDTINIPYTYTSGTTTFVTNTVGSRNAIKITDSTFAHI